MPWSNYALFINTTLEDAVLNITFSLNGIFDPHQKPLLLVSFNVVQLKVMPPEVLIPAKLFNVIGNTPQNKTVTYTQIKAFICPSNPYVNVYPYSTNYAPSYGPQFRWDATSGGVGVGLFAADVARGLREGGAPAGGSDGHGVQPARLELAAFRDRPLGELRDRERQGVASGRRTAATIRSISSNPARR